MGESAGCRKVFQYWNGTEDVYGDPLRIQDDLYMLLGDPDTAFEAAWGNEQKKTAEDKFDAEAVHASKVIVENAREAFRMVPFDPKTRHGATDEDVYAAVAALFAYFEKKSESTGVLPSS